MSRIIQPVPSLLELTANQTVGESKMGKHVSVGWTQCREKKFGPYGLLQKHVRGSSLPPSVFL